MRLREIVDRINDLNYLEIDQIFYACMVDAQLMKLFNLGDVYFSYEDSFGHLNCKTHQRERDEARDEWRDDWRENRVYIPTWRPTGATRDKNVTVLKIIVLPNIALVYVAVLVFFGNDQI